MPISNSQTDSDPQEVDLSPESHSASSPPSFLSATVVRDNDKHHPVEYWQTKDAGLDSVSFDDSARAGTHNADHGKGNRVGTPLPTEVGQPGSPTVKPDPQLHLRGGCDDETCEGMYCSLGFCEARSDDQLGG